MTKSERKKYQKLYWEKYYKRNKKKLQAKHKKYYQDYYKRNKKKLQAKHKKHYQYYKKYYQDYKKNKLAKKKPQKKTKKKTSILDLYNGGQCIIECPCCHKLRIVCHIGKLYKKDKICLDCRK